MQPPVPPSKRSERRDAPTTVPDAPAPPQWRAPGQAPTALAQAPGTRPKHTVRNVALGCLALLILPGIISALIRGVGGPSNSAPQNTAQTRPAGASDQVIVGLAVAALRTCSQAPVLNPANCPQSTNGPPDAVGITWSLFGDPASGARVVYQGGQFYAYGHTMMTVAYSRGAQPTLQALRIPFQATILWQNGKGRVTALGGADYPGGTLEVPRPAPLSDQAALDATRATLEQCARTTTQEWPSTCSVPLPPIYVYGATTNFHWKFASDPLVTAQAAYDAQYGVVHVIGSFALDFTYHDSFGNAHTGHGSVNYDSTVGLNQSGSVAVLLIKGA